MTTKYKLVPVEPTLVAWILYDATTDKKYIKMNPADGSLAIFDTEEAAMAAKRLTWGTEYERCEYYSAPQQPEGFCEDTALSLAERTFSTEVDEQLAEDIIQYARRLHSRYTVPQPVEQQLYDSAVVRLDKQDTHYPPCDFCDAIPDHHPWHGSGMFKGFDRPHIHACNDCRHLLPSPEVTKLVEALERISNMDSMSYHSLETAKIVAKRAVTAYHKQRGEL